MTPSTLPIKSARASGGTQNSAAPIKRPDVIRGRGSGIITRVAYMRREGTLVGASSYIPLTEAADRMYPLDT